MPVMTLLRLLQVCSTNLPVGGFTYSQGLEWAVEAKWVTNAIQTRHWLKRQMQTTLTYCDLPLLKRLYQTAAQADFVGFNDWSNWIIKNRETDELRQEEWQRGTAFYRFFKGIENTPILASSIQQALKQSQLAGMAFYAVWQQIPLSTLQTGVTYNLLENSVMAAIKLVPLGQQAGQQLLFSLAQTIPTIITKANQLTDSELGGGSPLIAIASCLHETQYTRLFRS